MSASRLESTPAAAAVAAAAEVSVSTFTVSGHGNGHAHGMSQYGAKGGALAGLNARQILAFYYPGTTLTTLAPSRIRVLVSGTTTYTTISADTSGLTVNGIVLPVGPGIGRYRLVPSGAGLAVQRLGTTPGSVWRTYRAGLPARADFATAYNYVRLFRADSTSTTYRGTIGAVRSGAGLVTINRLGLDGYVMGVVPREVPASWPGPTVRAQAIAARSYARNAVESHAGAAYDICDTTSCQVYGGMRHYDAAGNVLWTDYPPAVDYNANQVLRYGASTAFTQYSASSGGWTVDGGKPYLVAKADRYDNAASGDPYLNWTRSVPTSQVAGSYGLARVTSIEITRRDGHGDWGGRVLQAYVNGMTSSGASRHIETTGYRLQSALGVHSNWFIVRSPDTVPSAPRNVSAVAADGGGWVSWQAPATTGGTPITKYLLTFGTLRKSVDASVRRSFVGPRVNGVPARVEVRAVNAVGLSAATAVTFTPRANPQTVKALPAARLFDTRSTNTVVDSFHPFRFRVAGRSGVPLSGATAVQLAVTILHPSESGTLTVHTAGMVATRTSAISYPALVMTTTTVSVPLVSSSTVVFEVSRGRVELMADVMGYSQPGRRYLEAVDPVLVKVVPEVPTGSGVAVDVRTAAGPDATAVVLRVNGASSTTSGWLRVWSGGAPPPVSQVSVTRWAPNANTVITPISSGGAVRLAASGAGISARVSLVGVIGPDTPARGTLETYQANPIADGRAPFGGASLRVGPSPRTLQVLGASQIPSSGVQAVWLELSVTGAGSTGSLWVYATGSPRPVAAVAGFGGSRRTTVSALVPVGSDGTVTFATSGPAVTVGVDAMGWVSG